MTPWWRNWLIALLGLIVLFSAIYFPILRRRVKKQAQTPQPSEEQVRQELSQTSENNASQPRVKAKLFWAEDENATSLEPVTVELPLSDDPAMRAKQVLTTLIAGPVDSEQKTLPADAVLLAFYLLPDGTGIADFSEALATSTPSGVQSEQLAVDSITRTLQANVPQVKRLKFLIHGQQVETLAGHVDLTQTFLVDPNAKIAASDTPAPLPVAGGSSSNAPIPVTPSAAIPTPHP
jgi:hypothetical protein